MNPYVRFGLNHGVIEKSDLADAHKKKVLAIFYKNYGRTFK